MSGIHDESKLQEQKRVDHVINVIDQKMEQLQEKTGSLKEHIVSLRKNFWDDVTVNLDDPDDVIETHTSLRQQAELLAERERSHRGFHKQYKNLQRLKSSPYFGRIDFKEAGEEKAEQIYIGLFSLMDENDEEFLIYDWRAPISSMYYDFAPGPSHYETMDGTIHGEMELKRQYIIRNGKIKGMFDTGITIGDEILQAVLSSQADTQMKNIVATIQKEQNAIIRNDKKKYLVVQGAAGSGKTSAAMQRVAYLLYRYRNTLQADNILLFSPNPMFNSYVATVLPELGEDNMQQSTFYQYLQHRIKNLDVESPYNQLEYMLGSKRDHTYFIRKKSILLKSSLPYQSYIDQFAKTLLSEGMLFKNIKFRGDLFISKEEIADYFYRLTHIQTIPNRLVHVKNWLQERLDEKEKSEKTSEWVEMERELLEREEYLKVYKKLQRERRFTENTFDDFEREERLIADWIVKRKLKPLRKKINAYAFLDTVGIYRVFLHWLLTNENIQMPEEWKEICELTIANLSKRQIFYEDATPYLYLKDKLEGKHVHTSIRHVFIDEAQDYSPFQLAYLKQIFPNSKMTILGDMNQSIFVHSISHQHAFSQSSELFPEHELETIVLTKSYRSTKQIVEFTEQMLTDHHEIIPFNRNGKLPTVHIVENEDRLNRAICDKVKDLKAEFQTIAIICKTAQEAEKTYEHLCDQIPNMRLIKKETTSYEKGVLVIPSYLAKGIEFDAVIIYNGSKQVFDQEDERKLFYTACTRAMHELYIYSVGEVTPFINDVNPTTFLQING